MSPTLFAVCSSASYSSPTHRLDCAAEMFTWWFLLVLCALKGEEWGVHSMSQAHLCQLPVLPSPPSIMKPVHSLMTPLPPSLWREWRGLMSWGPPLQVYTGMYNNHEYLLPLSLYVCVVCFSEFDQQCRIQRVYDTS